MAKLLVRQRFSEPWAVALAPCAAEGDHEKHGGCRREVSRDDALKAAQAHRDSGSQAIVVPDDTHPEEVP